MDNVKIVKTPPKQFVEAVNASNLNQNGWEFSPSVEISAKDLDVEILIDESLSEDNRHMRGGSVSDFGTAYIIRTL